MKKTIIPYGVKMFQVKVVKNLFWFEDFFFNYAGLIWKQVSKRSTFSMKLIIMYIIKSIKIR